MTTVHTTTAGLIIDDAAFLVGRKNIGNALDAADITIFLRLLNDMIKQWEGLGVYLHTIQDLTIPLYDSKQSYVLSPTGDIATGRPIRCVSARRLDSTGYESPVTLLSREDYKTLSIKSSAGYTTLASYEKQNAYGLLYIWPVGDTASVSLENLWANSVAKSGEYHYTGALVTVEPTYVFANGTKLVEGTLGSLVAGEYAYGDNDSLGSDKLYVKPSTIPLGQSTVKVLLDTPSALLLSIQRPVDIFDADTDAGDFPSEMILALKYGLASIISDGTGISPQRQRQIKADAQNYFNVLKVTDQETTSFFFQPQTR